MPTISEKLAEQIVAELLDNGMRHSTWFDNNTQAFYDLTRYRIDMEAQVAKLLKDKLAAMLAVALTAKI
jgi:hypothetical protein